jgi:hypothetical protein
VPADLFPGFLRIAAIQFAVGAVLAQVATFRSLAGKDLSCDLRRAQWCASRRATIAGLTPAIVTFALWAPRTWPRARWDVLVGLEILLAFVLLAVGLAAVAVRYSHPAVRIEAETGTRGRELLVRVGILAAGWAYAAAVAIRIPGGPGETLFAVTALGAITLALGLSRRPAPRV